MALINQLNSKEQNDKKTQTIITKKWGGHI